MIKKITLLLLSSFYLPHIYSQTKIDLNAVPTLELAFNPIPCKLEGKINFSKILVEDYRFDTTKLGYIQQGGTRRIVMRNGVANELTRILNIYFKNNLDSSSDRTLVLILRHLWLQKGIDRNPNHSTLYPGKLGVNFSDFEIYSKQNDKYRALTKMRNEFIGVPFSEKGLGDLLFLSIDSAFKKITELNVEEVLKNKKEYTFSFINDVYFKRFDIPVLQPSVVLQRGVFLTFTDFKNNKIVYPDFTIKNGVSYKFLSVGPSENDTLYTFWGFFDGSKLFINLNLNFIQLIRQNNTFDLYGTKYPSEYETYILTAPVPGVLHDRPVGRPKKIPIQNKSDLKFMQVNMEDGDVY